MRNLKVAVFALAAFGVSAFGSAASAMPVSGLTATATPAATVEQVRWVCGPYRCWWRPGPYYRPLYGFWGPRHYWGWHRWGWHRHWW
jgi:hypothetical protein